MIKIYPFYVNSSKNVLMLLPPQLTEHFPSVMPLCSHIPPPTTTELSSLIDLSFLEFPIHYVTF